jgi:hypothetical protein
MKIRIKDNSLRYRLTKSEVQQLAISGQLQAKTEFLNSIFKYQIVVQENISELAADYKDNTITLFFPKAEADIWYDSDRITYEHKMPLGNGQSLKLLLEKDFVCLDHTDEDQSDNYPNPNKTC